MSQRLVYYSDLPAKGIKACKATLWRWEKAGKFPRRILVSQRKVAWLESQIDQHVADLIKTAAERAA